MVASEHLVTLLRSLSRLISPNGQTVDPQSYPKLAAVPMETDKLSKESKEGWPELLPLAGHLDYPLALVLADLFSRRPPLMPFDLQSTPPSLSLLEPWDQEDSPS